MVLSAVAAMTLLARPAGADPVAVVEAISASSLPVEYMDYVESGQTIALMPGESLVLGYFASCSRETIEGGVVTIGETSSAVQGGTLVREMIDCDAGRLVLSPKLVNRSGVLAFRGVSQETTEAAAPPSLTIHAASPFVRADASGLLRLQRLDVEEPMIRLQVSEKFVDLRLRGIALTPGGTYKVSLGESSRIVAVDPDASDANHEILSRLIRL